jgi:hypothetical protein
MYSRSQYRATRISSVTSIHSIFLERDFPSVRASKTLTPVLRPLWDEAFRPSETWFHPRWLLRPPEVAPATAQGGSCDRPRWLLRPPEVAPSTARGGSYGHPRCLLGPPEVAPSTARGGCFDRPRWLLRPLEVAASTPSSSPLVGW